MAEAEALKGRKQTYSLSLISLREYFIFLVGNGGGHNKASQRDYKRYDAKGILRTSLFLRRPETPALLP
jgi:hypothetical protein